MSSSKYWLESPNNVQQLCGNFSLIPIFCLIHMLHMIGMNFHDLSLQVL
jgi:hypothetical protein